MTASEAVRPAQRRLKAIRGKSADFSLVPGRGVVRAHSISPDCSDQPLVVPSDPTTSKFFMRLKSHQRREDVPRGRRDTAACSESCDGRRRSAPRASCVCPRVSATDWCQPKSKVAHLALEVLREEALRTRRHNVHPTSVRVLQRHCLVMMTHSQIRKSHVRVLQAHPQAVAFL